MSGESIGMMEGAFFVGRGELLQWLNDFFGFSLSKVEQCATGAVYCQIIDAIFGNVPLSKVKWTAKHDYEFVENYKVLQQAFAKNDIKKHIDVDKLVKAKYQDNLEFLQWLKRYFDLNYNGAEYDAVGRRKGQDLYYILGGGKVAQVSKGPSSQNPKAAAAKNMIQPKAGTSVKADAGSKSASAASQGSKKNVVPENNSEVQEQIKQLQMELQEAKLNMDTLEKERDFYFGKLRDIEVLLQTNTDKSTDLTDLVLKILYASEEEHVKVGDDGSLDIKPAHGGDDQ